MIYILALVAGVLLGVAWWMWRLKPSALPIVEPEAQELVEKIAPQPVDWQETFNLAHFTDTRRKYADDIDTEAQRVVAKLASVRQAMDDDMGALKRMRAQADVAKAEAAEMRQAKTEAEAMLEAQRAELRAVIQARQLATERIDQLDEKLSARDGEIARSREEITKLEMDHKAAVEACALSDEALARNGLLLHEAQINVLRLEQAVQQRDEQMAAQAGQIETLGAEVAARGEKIAALELQLAKLVERFEDARLESLMIMDKLRQSQEQANGRAEKLEVDGETMRRHIVETERARDRLLGQVGQLRAENAGLRAESQVKLRDLETLNAELTTNIAVLERMLANARTVRAQPAPARAHLRLIAQAKKTPGRASGG